MSPPSELHRGPVLDAVRSECRRVAEQAARVRIVTSRLDGYLDLLGDAFALQMEPGIHFRGEQEQTVAFFLTLDSVNFGSGYFPAILSDPKRSGYRTVAAALTGRFNADGPLSAEELRTMTPASCARLFGLDPSNAAALELAGLFARALADLGRFLLDRYDGRFSGPIEEARGSAEGLVRLLTRMPLFRDVAPYRERNVPFYKRAQIAAADLHIAFDAKGPGRFDDIDRLTLFADNLVPHVLRHDGLLVYDDDLAAAIDRGDLLPGGSPAEVEIRACAVHVVELLVREASRRRRPLSALHLDNLLWHRGQSPRYRALPRHRTLTPFY